MKRKKVNSLLKGVAGFGVALGGATVFTDADVVYADEIDAASNETKNSEEIVKKE